MRGPEIVGILALGAALGAVLPGSHIALSCAVAIAAAMVVASMYAKQGTEAVYAMVLLSGLCRGMQWKLTGGSDMLQELPFVQASFTSLVGVIGSMGLSDEAEALVRALVSGDRSGIAPGVRDAFRRSGASHLLALSGLHLGIIYALLSKTLGLAGGHPVASRVRGCLIILACGYYAILTGATPSIMRAFLFILLRETALMTGRNSNPLNIFSSALAIHLVMSPGSILMPGFQLSYLAMCGIYLLFPRIDAIYPKAKHDPFRKIWSLACLSISCQLFTAPVAWYHFRSFPKWFLLTNMIAMPLASVMMVTAVVALILSVLGICPGVMTRAVDLMAHALIWSLDAISGM